jgi:hypothetical protein
VQLVASVCNKGDTGISEGEKIYIWYVPDKEDGTARWTFPLSELPTGACGSFVSSVEAENVRIFEKIAGTFHFSASSDKSASKIHIPEEKREKDKALDQSKTIAQPAISLPKVADGPLPSPLTPNAVSPLNRCAPGTIYVPSLGVCGLPPDPSARQSSNFTRRPLPNILRCETDYFFHSEYERCVPNTTFEPIEYGKARKLFAGTDVYQAWPTTKHYKLFVLLGTVSISYSRASSKNRYVEQGYATDIFDYAEIQCKDCPAEFQTYEVERPQQARSVQ